MLRLMTKLGEFSPETVKAAFDKIEFTPDGSTYFDPENRCACALGAFVEANAPGVFANRQNYSSNHYTITQVLGITPQQESSITGGFFGPSVCDNELEELGKACRLAVGLE